MGDDRNPCREFHLLPARCCLIGKGRHGQSVAVAIPQGTGMGAGMGAGFVESDAGNIAVHIRFELDPQLEGTPFGIGPAVRDCPSSPDTARTVARTTI